MRSICYVMSGAAHAPYALTSLLSLRRYWTGKIRIFAWPESFEIMRMIAEDPHVDAEIVPVVPPYRGKNAQFLHKIQIMQQLDSGPNLYLDADTLIIGSVEELFRGAEEFGFVATQFQHWTTGGGLIRNRINRLREFPIVDSSLIDQLFGNCYPSVNGGVFCCQPNNTVLSVWYAWSWEARSIFIADECVLHLMVPKFEPQGRIVVAPGRFNSSPKYVAEEDKPLVRIWHGHGDCWTRPNKSREGYRMWWKEFAYVTNMNIGQVQMWASKCGNKYLDKLLGVSFDVSEGCEQVEDTL